MPERRRGRRVGGLLAALAALLVAGVLATVTAPAASAHSILERSDPASGARLATSPQRVTLTFNEALQSSFPALTIVGPDKNFWQDGDPVVTGPTISVAVRPLGPAGTYTVNYRVTSADGHPVEGQRQFTLTAAGTGTPGPSASAPASGGADDGPPIWPFIAVAVVVLAGGLAVVFLRGRTGGAGGRK